MSKKAEKRDYKREYATYQGKPEHIRERSNRNKARRKLMKEGLVHKGDGKDVDHKDSQPMHNSRKNLRVQTDNDNRSYSRKGKGAKKYGKRYK